MVDGDSLVSRKVRGLGANVKVADAEVDAEANADADADAADILWIRLEFSPASIAGPIRFLTLDNHEIYVHDYDNESIYLHVVIDHVQHL